MTGAVPTSPREPGRSLGQRWLGRSAPLVTGALLVAVLAALAVLIGRVQLHRAESRLIAERGEIVSAIADYRSRSDDPRILAAMGKVAGFDPANPQLDDLTLTAFELSPTQDPNLAVALLDRSGRKLVAHPAGADLPAASFGPAWNAALRGVPSWSPVFRYGGRPVRAELAPLGGDPKAGTPPWGVLVEVGEDVAGARFKRTLGALGPGRGGMSEVDASGVAVSSWDPAEIGTRVVEPGRLPPPTLREAGGEEVRAIHWTEDGGDGRSRTVIASPEATTGYTIIFAAPTDSLLSAPRRQQRVRDLTLVAALTVSALGLVAFGALREIAVRRSRSRLRDLLANTHDLVALLTGDDARVAFLTSSARRLLDRPERCLIGHPVTEFVHPDDRSRVAALLEEVARTGWTSLTDVRLRAGPDRPGQDGGPGARYHWFDVTAYDARGDPDVGGILVTCHEVDERKALQDELGHQARHDPLTGLPNRATFQSRLAGALATSAADGTRDAVLFVDLDDFKPVNDELGHAAGDEVLRIIARRVVATLRPGDVACRFGGDEFGALLRDVGPETARAVADRLVAVIGMPVTLSDAAEPQWARPLGPTSVRVGASIGVALSTPGRSGIDMHALLRAADQAMYTAKRERAGPRVVLAPDPTPSLPPAREPVLAVPRVPRRPCGQPATHPAGPGAARLADPRGACTRPWRRWRRVVRTLAPLTGVGALLFGVVGVGVWGDRQVSDAARANTIADQRTVLLAIDSSASALLDPVRLSRLLSSFPWTFSAADITVLARLARSPIVGAGADLTLASPAGQVLAAYPPGTRLAVDPAGAGWRAAAVGHGGWTPVTRVGGVDRVYAMQPLLRGGKVAAVLVVGRPSRTGLPAQLLGSLARAGIVELVDSGGRAGFSSDPANAGRQVVPASALRGLRAGTVRELPDAAGYHAFVTPTTTLADYFLVLRRLPADMFNDIGSTLPQVAILLGIGVLTLAAVAVADERRQRALRREADRFDALLRGAHDIVAAVGPDARVSVVGPSITRLLGLRVGDWAGHDVGTLAHPDDAERLRDFVTRTAAEPCAPGGSASAPPPEARQDGAPIPVASITDVRLRTAGGRHRWFDITASAPTPSCEITGLLLTCHEIGERKALQDELTAAAHRDPLTGLPNRAAFTRGVEEAARRAAARLPRGTAARLAAARGGWAQTRGWARAETGPDGHELPRAPYGVLFVDLDHFKPVNDTYGHDVGDQLLEIVAMRLDAAVRADDLVARLGGDEFAVLVEDTDAEELADLGERILDALGAPVVTRAAVVTVGATIGAALGDPGTDPARTVRDADAAMYEAKRRGRGRVVVAVGPAHAQQH